MRTLTKAQIDQLAEYKRASDELRKRISATALPDEREILPVNGRIHLDLTSCTPLTPDQQKALFGESVFSDAVLREIANDGN
ncbi:hypothetical protein CR152_11925 [Massilia violaceinigra]|uniref:Uncharacterized protein n=1 Tax=Massilia violaceinigra TaxID=2045208 RepID=A0A2D2DJJ5_9BURK|nr:hypothetical protein [Massilia violaceinigra]ATQ75147.1 hypothetical protein CR152_11925 [Massilia violaceinigra]